MLSFSEIRSFAIGLRFNSDLNRVVFEKQFSTEMPDHAQHQTKREPLSLHYFGESNFLALLKCLSANFKSH